MSMVDLVHSYLIWMISHQPDTNLTLTNMYVLMDDSIELECLPHQVNWLENRSIVSMLVCMHMFNIMSNDEVI
jgi:hypothetical protein